MKSILITIVILSLTSYSYGDEQAQFFNEISKQEFGQTVIETIQLELRQEDSVNRILGMLKDMQAEIQDDQNHANTQIQARQQTCNSKVAEIDAIVARANQKKAEDEQQVPLKEEELQDKQRQASEKNDEEQRNNDRIALLTQERKENRALYEQRRDELTGMVSALKQGRQIIAQLKTGSFLQENEGVFSEIKDHHKTFQKRYPNRRGYYSLVNVLLETLQDQGVRADQNLVGGAIAIFDDLIDSIYQLQKEEMIADDRREAAFQQAKARLQLGNRQLEQSVATMNALVQVLTQRLLELSNDINMQQQIADTKGIEKQDWLKTCNDEQQAFRVQTAGRSEQLDIITRCIQIFETGLSQEARQRLAQIQIQ